MIMNIPIGSSTLFNNEKFSYGYFVTPISDKADFRSEVRSNANRVDSKMQKYSFQTYNGTQSKF